MNLRKSLHFISKLSCSWLQVLLLLWKVLLTSLGGMEDLRALKTDYRRREALPEIKEDTLTVSRHMRAASPPASAADILDATNNR